MAVNQIDELKRENLCLRQSLEKAAALEKIHTDQIKSMAIQIEQLEMCIRELANECKRVNQCFKCKYGYRSNSTAGCPGEADAELPCAGYKEEERGLVTLENAIAKAEELINPKPETEALEGERE